MRLAALLFLAACANEAPPPRITDDTPRTPAEQVEMMCRLATGQLKILAGALDRGQIDNEGAGWWIAGAQPAIQLCRGELVSRTAPRSETYRDRASLDELIRTLEARNVIPSR